MQSLRDALERDGVAMGHFNVSDWVLLKAVLASGQELNVPGKQRLVGLFVGPVRH
jgi:fructose-bisphosphate aldolase class II